MSRVTDNIGPRAIIPAWLIGRVSSRALEVYAVLASEEIDYQTRDTDEPTSRAKLAKRLDVSVSAIHRALSELVEAGAVEKLGGKRGDGGQDAYDYHLDLTRPEWRGPVSEMTGGAVSEMEPPSLQRSTPQSSLLPGGSSSVGAVSESERGSAVENGSRPRVWKVDRTPVTEIHATLAREVLVVWNEQTGQRLASRDWLAKIVMRIREHPELGIEEHSHVIVASLADPWWKGPPSPSVVYGNGAQFERCIVVATRGTARDPRNVTSADLRAAAAAIRERGTT